MSDSRDIADRLIAALPAEADTRATLIALGLVMTGVIQGDQDIENRSELVELVADLLRQGVNTGLH